MGYQFLSFDSGSSGLFFFFLSVWVDFFSTGVSALIIAQDI